LGLDWRNALFLRENGAARMAAALPGHIPVDGAGESWGIDAGLESE
jgi:hypothetical protein